VGRIVGICILWKQNYQNVLIVGVLLKETGVYASMEIK